MDRPQLWTSTVIIGAVVIDDRVTKVAATNAGVVAHNADYALGVAGGPPLLLILGAVLALGAFIGLISRSAARLGVSPLFSALILGGALGNLLDRIQYGSVRDFMHTPWAIINFADVVGFCGLLGLTMTFLVRLYELHRDRYEIRFDRTRLVAFAVPPSDQQLAA